MPTTIIRDPSPAAKALAVRMVHDSQGNTPDDVIDAAVNVLGIHMTSHALLSRMKRGEARAFFRKCANSAMEMAISNFDKAAK